MMRYWLKVLSKNIHNISKQQFILDKQGVSIGLVELVEINHIYHRTEFSMFTQ
ncbi:MAG: hypothetical protein HNEKOMLI_00272 [Sodalis sp. Psp]|nr:hypothetical protein [Sodalis sp. Psp]MCR3756769.1 hypothetical protein [Sodalis sp. Ppy]